MKKRNTSSGRGKLALGLVLFALILVAMAAFLIVSILMPYIKAKNTMDPDGILTLQVLDDGGIQASWPVGDNAESYTLTVSSPEGKTLFSCVTGSQCTAVLPGDLPADQELTFTVASSCSYRKKQRPGKHVLQAKTTLSMPGVTDIHYTTDPDTDRVDITFQMPADGTCQVFTPLFEGGSKPYAQMQKTAFSIQFGADKDFQVPQYGQTCDFTFRVYRSQKNLVFFGTESGKISLTREDFLGSVLQLTSTPLGNNNYTLQWNQTKGDGYMLEVSRDNVQWQTVSTFESSSALTYETGYLDPFSQYYYRVSALGESSEPAVICLDTAQKAVYSTVWPLTELNIYSDSTGDTVLGTTKEGEALCVLGEENGRFAIAYQDTVGYIPSDLCLINLPELMGDLCSYDIVNSYDACYMVHEFAMDQITGTKISGYTNVQLYDGSFLVPMLYPTAKKLMVAAQDALQQGYRLKIYDAFHPRTATASLYPMAQDLENVLIPKSAYSGYPLSDLTKMKWIVPEQIPQWVIDGYKLDKNGDPIKPKALPLPQPTEDDPDPLAEMTTDEVQRYYLMRELTYGILMTDNGRYSLEDYFPRGKYLSNAGLTVDVTLEALDGTPLTMQTNIFDMSWFSEVAANNENAALLQTIMTNAGFTGNAGRWWHFADEEATVEHTLLDGISAKGWVKDALGWRYRQDNGRFYRSCREEIDGFICTFDENGYADIDKI